MVRGQPERAGQIGERDAPRAVAVAFVQPHEPEHAGVDHRPAQAQALTAQRRSQEAALDRGHVDDGDPPRHHGEQRVDRHVERRRAGEVGDAYPVHANRGLAHRAQRTDPPVHGGAQLHASVLDRDRAERDDLVPFGVKAGQLEIDRAVARRTPRRPPPGQARAPVGDGARTARPVQDLFQNRRCGRGVHGSSWATRDGEGRAGGTGEPARGDPAPCPGTHPGVPIFLKQVLRMLIAP